MPKKYLLFKDDGSRYEFNTYEEFYNIAVFGERVTDYKLFKGEIPIDISYDTVDYIWENFDAKNTNQIMALFNYAERYMSER